MRLWIARAVHAAERPADLCDVWHPTGAGAGAAGVLLMDLAILGLVGVLAIGVGYAFVVLLRQLDLVRAAVQALPTEFPVPPLPPPAPTPPPVGQTASPFAPRPASPTTILCVDRHRRCPRTVTVDRAGYLVRLPGGEYHRVGTERGLPVYALANGNHALAMKAVRTIH